MVGDLAGGYGGGKGVQAQTDGSRKGSAVSEGGGEDEEAAGGAEVEVVAGGFVAVIHGLGAKQDEAASRLVRLRADVSLSRRNKWGNKNTAVSSGVNPFPAVALALFLTVGAVYCYGFHKGILQQLQVAVSLKGYSFVAAVRPRRQAQSEFLPVCEESGVSFAHSKSVRVMLYVFENGVKVSAGPQNLVVEAFCENGNESGCGCGLRCKQGVPVLQPLTGKGFQACYICA